MEISTLGILGAGTMGSGIAIASAFAGLEVILVDAKEAQVDAALNKAAAFAARQVEKGRITRESADEAMARISGVGSAEALADCDLIIEAVFEDFDLKAQVFGALSNIVREDAILATNTSCLRVSDLARHVTNPARFLGLHYFIPAEVNPLVEVVRGEATSQATFAAASAFVVATTKKPLACKDAYGFAVNRFFCPYTNEACRLVGEGLATTAQVDRVAKSALGVQAGPFFVQNLIKPHINLHAIGNLKPLGKFYEAAPFLVQVGSSDKPFEISADGDAKNDAIIQDRMRAAVFLAILQELDEGVAEPAAIDMGAEVALRFQAPCRLMDSLGRVEVERIVGALAATHGLPLPKSLTRVGSLRGH